MKLALLGLGTVGSGVLKVLQENREIIEKRVGEPLQVTHVYSRSLKNRHNADLTGIKHTNDFEEIVKSSPDLMIEVIGGVDLSYDLIKRSLKAGVPVVTANKDMLALHIDELAALANENQVQLGYEASCAGGIPIIQALENSLNANQITQIMGILNGTTNYILTRMSQDGWDYPKALKEAQAKGYAEADPTNDVEGFDAQRKLALLSRLAYEQQIKLEDIKVNGISNLEAADIDIAKEAGYIVKLLGISECIDDELNLSVAPTLLPEHHPLAQVDDGMNAVFVRGNAVGEVMFYGPGAGSKETASAVVSDIMNIAKYGFSGNFEADKEAVVKDDHIKHAYYIRMPETKEEVVAKVGVEWIQKELSEDQRGYTVQTVRMTRLELQDLMNQLDVMAYYHLVVGE